MSKLTVKEAATKWVNEFNFYSSAVVERLIGGDEYTYVDEFVDLTPITEGDYVSYNGVDFELSTFEAGPVIDGKTHVKDEEGKDVQVPIEDLEHVDQPDLLPMWGTMFEVPDMDQEWVLDNLDKVAACGFRIFEMESLDLLLLGVDGAGYDFYEAHWIPLYTARGLKWHTEEEE